MKKYLVLLLGVLFVLGFAATSFAIHAEIPSETQAVVAKGTTQITIGGEIRIRGEFRSNTKDFLDDGGAKTANDDHRAIYETRVRLSFDAQVTPNTRGFLMLESDRSDGSDTDTNDNVIWGSPAAHGATGSYKYGNSKIGDMRILQAWIQHSGSGLLGTPALVKIGHMPIKLGRGLFLDHSKFGDDAILFGIDPTKDIHIILHTVKFAENVAEQNDDATAYGVIAAWDIDKKSSVSADLTYVDHQRWSGTNNIHLWNLGIRGDTDISGLGLYGDVEWQFGKVENTLDLKFKGYAVMLGATYKIAPVKLNAEFALGSGDDQIGDSKIKTFVTTLGADQHYTYVYEYRTATAGTKAVSGGLANTTYFKLGADADLTKDIAANLAVYFLKATKKVYGADYLVTPVVATDSKSIGTEICGKVAYKIDKNLVYWIEGGYLFAGNYWKVVTAGVDPDDAYAIRHGIQLNF